MSAEYRSHSVPGCKRFRLARSLCFTENSRLCHVFRAFIP